MSKERRQYEDFVRKGAIRDLDEVIRLMGKMQSDFANSGMVSESHNALRIGVEAIRLKERLEDE